MKSQRPLIVTLLCLVGFFVAGILGPMLVYSPEIQKFGKLYALYRSLGFAALVACFYGLWNMRRWAAWVFGIYFLSDQVVHLLMGTWTAGTLGPLLVLAVLLGYYRRMQ